MRLLIPLFRRTWRWMPSYAEISPVSGAMARMGVVRQTVLLYCMWDLLWRSHLAEPDVGQVQ